MKAKVRIRIRIRCENPKCSNRETEINSVLIEYPPEEIDYQVEIFLSNYGTGSEDPEDFCPICGVLGVAQEPERESV